MASLYGQGAHCCWGKVTNTYARPAHAEEPTSPAATTLNSCFLVEHLQHLELLLNSVIRTVVIFNTMTTTPAYSVHMRNAVKVLSTLFYCEVSSALDVDNPNCCCIFYKPHMSTPPPPQSQPTSLSWPSNGPHGMMMPPHNDEPMTTCYNNDMQREVTCHKEATCEEEVIQQ